MTTSTVLKSSLSSNLVLVKEGSRVKVEKYGFPWSIWGTEVNSSRGLAMKSANIAIERKPKRTPNFCRTGTTVREKAVGFTKTIWLMI